MIFNMKGCKFMPLFAREKCDHCGVWDWFRVNTDGKYICRKCKEKRKELETEAISQAVKE